ncbi:lipopolysaccharide biosynthesis protein RfbH [Candidatus Gottesmanbacteria bacterium RBG_13_45_10]|uniref:Lipopolysaccharide biosynthesis protein RfbH n=1 Tax=Candidatus Gottesmanbacteria bacterium RBG_13_45_10 TaxID=1798370 RepID=A0A1F5ZHH0_9BACT|nr:MAG: lipopolysaccharide biosynthesis protein RfbH [Candidatus Gottesmanbacteria bacterium RBG_13_45_10]
MNLNMMTNIIKKNIVSYYKKTFPKKKFVPGTSPVPVSGKVFDEKELLSGVEAVLDGWWTEGRFALEFEREFAKFLGVKYVSLVSSGSSANLVALSALTSSIFREKALKPGDEVITVATGFPTTVNPIIQNRGTAVFCDNDIVTKNVNPKDLEKAITPKTRVIMMAHTLGNLMPLDEIMALVAKYNLWFIEDCCDALGGKYKGKLAGTFGHIATFSFYPAHQITMGEGGAVVTSDPRIHRAVRQFRDWGRDCWCDTGKDNTCKMRFGWKMGELPYGYDHKYIYSQVGYNLKLTDMQAAIGVAQLAKLPGFIRARRENYSRLLRELKSLNKYFIFNEVLPGADPSWFGFPIVVRDGAPFTKLELVTYLEHNHIATRSIFAGNLTRHPAYLKRKDIRIVGTLKNSDKLMNDGFWIGVYPGITSQMLTYVKKTISSFVLQYEKPGR